jgi:hypothetical protein
MNRSYSILTVKAVDEEQRIIQGTATTPTPDRVGDIIDPLGVKYTNPLPLLHQHDSERPVGTVTFDRPTKDGITFEARLPMIAEAGPLKDRVDTAWGALPIYGDGSAGDVACQRASQCGGKNLRREVDRCAAACRDRQRAAGVRSPDPSRRFGEEIRQTRFVATQGGSGNEDL